MMKIQLLRCWWRFAWFGWMRFTKLSDHRCDGYRPIGGHLAQYCLRCRGHRGLCLAYIRPTNHEDVFEFGSFEFTPEKGGNATRGGR